MVQNVTRGNGTAYAVPMNEHLLFQNHENPEKTMSRHAYEVKFFKPSFKVTGTPEKKARHDR